MMSGEMRLVSLDKSQAMRLAQPAEQHGHELAPAGTPSIVALCTGHCKPNFGS